MESFLILAFIFLVAGVIAVPLASRFGLGSVLGYLLAGIAISPILAALDVDVISLQHFAEFGVVMMLFLVGLELEPRLLWEMRNRLLGLGGLQVALTAGLVMAAALAMGLPWTVALAIGLVVSLSSTAIVLQTLNERGLMKSEGGQASFSVLLFQDIAVIPMLAFIPLLAMPELIDGWGAAEGHATAGAHGAEAGHGGDHGADHGADHGGDHGGDHGHGAAGPAWIETIPGYLRALVTIGAIGFVIVAGSLLTRPVFRFVAMANLRELFTATALMMVIGIAVLMSFVGLSPALGTFLAGVVLANSEFRHELESDIDPFRGLLLGLFFMTVGAGINFGLLGAQFFTVLGLTLGLMLLKAAVLLGLAYAFGVRGADKALFSLGLAQAGEFGFVLLSFTVANKVIPQAIADQLLLVVALSMLLTPGLFILYDKVILPRLSGTQTRPHDEIDDSGPIIIAGFGRFGGIVNRILLAAGHKTVVLDHAFEQLEMLRAFDAQVFYGDATRPDLLHAAGIAEAKMLVVAIDDEHRITDLTRYVSQNHPHVHIVARARNRHHVYELFAAGAHDIIRETFDSSLRAGRSALEALGAHPFEAERMVRGFERQDRRQLRELAALYDPEIPTHLNAPYVARAKEMREDMEAEMRGTGNAFGGRYQRGWVPPSSKDVEAEAAASGGGESGDQPPDTA
ncbi:Glutathione-regulated potassium-efflux system protein KefC [Pseudoruegeria aquimaris]|uniref:Glutathione-regulated potassium-efflux system protein KefC n=1 Tax=Pseudoruegeria aquimaris TaxID=393663 RepID=A0A1Y5RHL5_9RHOB|nr:cation:proton antiporter [Pseudoruegeria aquimaris]SLN17523.1 Glutathione-regulated potassium-efflux system protein KefC [Pseudoruegeria aquimaris]